MTPLRRFRAVAFVVLGMLAPGAAVFGDASAQNGSVAYTYDALGRIVAASYDTGVCIAYTYDANGNRLSQKILATAPGGQAVWGCFNWNSSGGAVWGP